MKTLIQFSRLKFAKKNIFCLLFILFCFQNNYAQSLINFGSNILITGPSTTPLSNQKNAITLFGDYVNEVSGLLNGTIEQDGGTIAVRGNWYNNASNNVFTTDLGSNSNGFVLFDGGSSVTQYISGLNPTHFENIVAINKRKVLNNDNNLVNGRLILNSIFELNGNRFIINNPNPTAINYIGGFIKSETLPGQYGFIQWNINNSLGKYSIPFGNDLSPFNKNLEFSINVKSSMNVGDFLSFATYPTDIFNEPLPIGSSPLELEVRNVVDRFWIIESSNPALNPQSDLSFSYTSADMKPAYNSININRLKASRNNTILNTWSDIAPLGNQSGSTVLVENVDGSNLFESWTLINTPEALADLFVPDGFSPNGDGMNDIFIPIIHPDFEVIDYELVIYNRWGQIVFKTHEVGVGWDGKMQGSDADPLIGVYTWLILVKGKSRELINATGVSKRYTGRITLIK